MVHCKPLAKKSAAVLLLAAVSFESASYDIVQSALAAKALFTPKCCSKASG
jgi:hypothetical protein